MGFLWVSHMVPYPPKSGALIRAYNLLKALAERHPVDLVAFVQEPLMRTLFQDAQQGVAECHRELTQLCREVKFLPIERLERPFGKARTALESLAGGNGYMADWLRSPTAVSAISELTARNRYTLAHLDTISLARYRELLPNVPATLGHHNVESHLMQRRAGTETTLLKRMYFRQEASRLAAYEREQVPRFAANIVCSDLDAQRLREVVPGAHTETIPNGVDCGYFRPPAGAQQADSMIFVGTLDWYPNTAAVLYLLQEIWPRLLQLRSNPVLHIVGANAPLAVVRAARAAAGVTLHGFVPDVRPLIDSAALYVCPIRDGGGTKLKILDACAMQKCIVADPVACEGINVRHGVSVELAETPEKFVQSLVRLLDSPDTRAAMGRAARALAESEYSFDIIGSRFVQVLERIAAQPVSSTAG
jgi:glycosyltransferase involved in cell wall biosynthesis